MIVDPRFRVIASIHVSRSILNRSRRAHNPLGGNGSPECPPGSWDRTSSPRHARLTDLIDVDPVLPSHRVASLHTNLERCRGAEGMARERDADHVLRDFVARLSERMASTIEATVRITAHRPILAVDGFEVAEPRERSPRRSLCE